jgi:hypothetical protein
MKYLWLLAALTVAGVIIMCNIKQTNDWVAQHQPKQDAVQMAMDALQGNPTAAGQKK